MPRVAVCVSGQLRTFREAVPNLWKNLIEPLNADVFVATWSEIGNTNKLILFLPRGFHMALPYEFWHANPDALADKDTKFQNLFPKLFQALQDSASSHQQVTHAEIVDLYKAKAAIVEPFDKKIFSDRFDFEKLSSLFPDNTVLNAVPMFYKICQADNLRRQYEVTRQARYDWVIRIRPDVDVGERFDVSELRGDKVRSLRNPFYEALQKTEVLSNDMMFFGPGAAMSVVSDLYRYLDIYWRKENFSELDFSERGPERVLNHFLRFNDILGETYSPPVQPNRIVHGIPFSVMMECLKEDLSKVKEIPEWIAKMVGLCHSSVVFDLFIIRKYAEAQALSEEVFSFGDFQCDRPYVGLAKMASMQGDQVSFERYRDLAARAGQQQLFPELFAS